MGSAWLALTHVARSAKGSLPPLPLLLLEFFSLDPSTHCLMRKRSVCSASLCVSAQARKHAPALAAPAHSPQLRPSLRMPGPAVKTAAAPHRSIPGRRLAHASAHHPVNTAACAATQPRQYGGEWPPETVVPAAAGAPSIRRPGREVNTARLAAPSSSRILLQRALEECHRGLHAA